MAKLSTATLKTCHTPELQLQFKSSLPFSYYFPIELEVNSSSVFMHTFTGLVRCQPLLTSKNCIQFQNTTYIPLFTSKSCIQFQNTNYLSSRLRIVFNFRTQTTTTTRAMKSVWSMKWRADRPLLVWGIVKYNEVLFAIQSKQNAK